MTRDLDDLMRDNIIDSRDLWQRSVDIENELVDADEAIEENADTAAYFAELREELDALNDIIETINGYSGNQARDGVTLVADNYFEAYARDYAEDIGAVDSSARWPHDNIDWKQAALDLQSDYTSVTIGSTDYWFA